MEILTEMKSQRNIEIDREGETDSSLVRLELQRGEEDRQPLIKISHKLEPNAGVFTARSPLLTQPKTHKYFNLKPILPTICSN